ncbi:MAG TPA: hypothetical protein VN372_14140 [Methanospirillum sp.]|nr:hypothetical protein [Methanospirillum sp.]
MSIVDDIRPILINDETVFRLIGFTDPKVKEIKSFRGTFPNKTKLPCITYADSSGVPGSLVNRDLTFLITSWGSSDVECQAVANAIEKALDSWSGVLNGVQVVKIACTFWQDSLTEVTTNLWYSIRKFEIIHW